MRLGKATLHVATAHVYQTQSHPCEQMHAHFSWFAFLPRKELSTTKPSILHKVYCSNWTQSAKLQAKLQTVNLYLPTSPVSTLHQLVVNALRALCSFPVAQGPHPCHAHHHASPCIYLESCPVLPCWPCWKLILNSHNVLVIFHAQYVPLFKSTIP